MTQSTRLALCIENIDNCSFSRIYCVWRKVYWKKGKKRNDSKISVLDNTSKQIYRFDSDVFNRHFRLLKPTDIEPNLWKKIQKMEACEKKKPPSTKKS
jgi:hypothetical protein